MFPRGISSSAWPAATRPKIASLEHPIRLSSVLVFSAWCWIILRAQGRAFQHVEARRYVTCWAGETML